MKKRIGICLMVLFVLFSGVSCAKKDESVPEGYLLAENPGADYTFFYPETWTLDRADAGMTSVYYSDTDFSNVTLTAFTASMPYSSIASYIEEYYFTKFEDNFNNLSLSYNQDGSLKLKGVKVDGLDGVSVDYKAAFSGEEYAFRSVFVYYDGVYYTLTYTAKSDLFESHLADVDGIVNNLRF